MCACVRVSVNVSVRESRAFLWARVDFQMDRDRDLVNDEAGAHIRSMVAFARMRQRLCVGV